jgi:hypothetical protein
MIARMKARRPEPNAVKRLVVATLLSLLPCAGTQAQELLCLTPFDWCPLEASLVPGQVCGCAGDRGVVVTVDGDGYLADQIPGEVCHTNFDPCLVEQSLVGDECECGALPGIVGTYE